MALIDVVDNTTVVVPVDDTHPCDPTHMEDADDIARMNNMHEAPLLDLLRRRYKKDQIYTFTGEILISINPYKDIPNLYSLATDDHEKGKGKKHPLNEETYIWYGMYWYRIVYFCSAGRI